MAYVKEIHTNELKHMDNEITEAQVHDDTPPLGKSIWGKRLGMDCDRVDWLRLRGAIREELKRRNNKKGDKNE